MSTRGGSSAMTLNHIGTMTSIGFEGDNYDRTDRLFAQRMIPKILRTMP